MGTRDMAEAVETFGRKFMEGAAGTAGRVADACAWLAANPGGMAPHDMELEPARLVGGVPDGLSAAAVTAAAALDDSGMAAASRPEPVANGRRATSVQFLYGHSIRLKCRHSRPGGSRSPATAPSGSGGGWTPSRRPPGSRPGNARAAWTSTMRSGILRCSPGTRGSGTRASVCGGWTA